MHTIIPVIECLYPGKKQIFKIASITNIANQNKKTLNPFDILGSFIGKII